MASAYAPLSASGLVQSAARLATGKRTSDAASSGGLEQSRPWDFSRPQAKSGPIGLRFIVVSPSLRKSSKCRAGSGPVATAPHAIGKCGPRRTVAFVIYAEIYRILRTYKFCSIFLPLKSDNRSGQIAHMLASKAVAA
jgi:hypothetical protein